MSQKRRFVNTPAWYAMWVFVGWAAMRIATYVLAGPTQGGTP